MKRRSQHLSVRVAPLLAISFISITAISCGKVGAPVAPARFTIRASELAAIQRGSIVVLSWPVPPLAKDDSSRSYIARADIYRLLERRDEEPVLDAEDYEESAQVIGYLDRATIEAQASSSGRLEYRDAVDLSQPSRLANVRLRYAVRYVNKRDQAAQFSNTVAIEPAPGVAQPPAGLAAQTPSQDLVTLSWSPPESNVDGTRPASIVGYNIYRRAARRSTFGGPINEDPVTEASFIDKDFQYGQQYVYMVRSLSQGPNGLIESAESESITFTPLDTFPPSAPDPVTVASANGIISVFWPSAPERDVAGYNLYRAEQADATGSQWVKLNDQLLKPLTYRDERVIVDRKYFYRVTAVDIHGNQSAPTKVVSETAHP